MVRIGGNYSGKMRCGFVLFYKSARYAVSKINHEEMYNTFCIMDENRYPLYMVGNSTQDEMREYLNEWGGEDNLKEDWYEEYGKFQK